MNFLGQTSEAGRLLGLPHHMLLNYCADALVGLQAATGAVCSALLLSSVTYIHVHNYAWLWHSVECATTIIVVDPQVESTLMR